MKPEVVFGLENAVWPAVLVNGSGVVLLTNAAAPRLSVAALHQYVILVRVVPVVNPRPVRI